MKPTNKEDNNIVSYRAAVDGFNPDTDTLKVVFATENPILLQGYKYSDSWEIFREILVCNEEAIRKERLEIGLPLFPDHWSRSANEVIGKTISYQIVDGRCIAEIKLGARADEALRSDLKNGIINTVSVGCQIYRVEKDLIENVPTYRAIDWEALHIALAPEPADTAATTIRSCEIIETNKPEIKKPDLLKTIFEK